jgi:hypothetical protein
MATDCLKREERRTQAVTKVKVSSHERDINVEVNLVHKWEDSSLGYNDNGFRIQELYRGLSPQQGFEQKEMGTGEIYATVFSTEEGGALKAR